MSEIDNDAIPVHLHFVSRTCLNCRWSREIRDKVDTWNHKLEFVVRHCQFNPPKANGFPTVKDDDFCKEFSQRP